MDKYRTYESRVIDFFATQDTHKVRCWCGSSRSVPVFKKGKMRIVRCVECATLFNETPPTPMALAKFYKESDAMKTWSEIKDQQDQLYKFGKAIDRMHSEGVKSVLDIGCGNGVFLKHCKSRGMRVLGVEPNKNAAEACRRNNIPVEEQPYGQFFYNNRKRFDCVTLWGVLEHVPDPLELLSRIRGMAERVVICVPNARSKVVETLGRECFTFCPQHLWYFDFLSLEKILFQSKFEHGQSWTIEPEVVPCIRKEKGHRPYDHSVPIEKLITNHALHKMEDSVLEKRKGYKIITIAS